MTIKVLDLKRNIFYFMIFLAGLLLMVWEIVIYRKTIVSAYLLGAVIVGVGSTAAFIDWEPYKSTYVVKGIRLYLYAFMQNTISWGFLACACLVLSNYYFASVVTTVEYYEIVEVSTMPGYNGSRSRRQPLVKINYRGERKELVFKNEDLDLLDKSTHVELEIKKGLLNWDVLVGQKLK